MCRMKIINAIIVLFAVFLSLNSRASDELPVRLIPSREPGNQPMVFIISGDGGWNSFIQSVSECFAGKGMPVVGLDSKKYFWNGRSPDGTADEINAAIARYMKQWNRKSYILVGFSFGGCVAPFVAARTPVVLREQMDGIYSISPDTRGDFEIHISDMLSLGASAGKYDVIAEMKKLKALRPVCIFGSQENTTVRRDFAEAGIKVVTLNGNHHYNNNYCALAVAVIKNSQNN